MNFSESYAKFRGGRAFLIALCGVLVFWFTWNTLPFLPHFDPNWSLLNVFLSVEASLSVALLIMANEKIEHERIQQDKYMLALLEAQAATAQMLLARLPPT